MDRIRALREHVETLPVSKRQLKDGDCWENWAAEEGACVPRRHHYPAAVSEIQAIVKNALKRREKVRVAGAGMSYNQIAFTDDHMVHLDKMTAVERIDSAAKTVTVQAGCSLAALSNELHLNGFSLHILPTVLYGTVAGSIAVAAHGSGLHLPSLSAAVIAVTVVNGRGEVVTIDESTPLPTQAAEVVASAFAPRLPVEGADMAKFTPKLLDAYRCHLGVLGVLTSVTLRMERAATVHVVRRPVPVRKLQSVVASRANMSDYYLFWWMPHTDMAFETVAKRRPVTDDERVSSVAGSIHTVAESSGVNSAGPVTTDQHGGRERRWVVSNSRRSERLKAALKGPWLQRDVTEYALAVSSTAPALQPALNRAYLKLFMGDQESFGPLHKTLVLPTEPIRQHAIEYAVDADKWRELFSAVMRIVEKRKLRVHFPVEVRFVDAESSWMAPSFGRKTCYIGLVMYKPRGLDSADWLPYYREFDAVASALGGRPHWSKRFTWGPRNFYRAYPMMQAFCAVRKAADPHDIFANDWWQRIEGSGPEDEGRRGTASKL